MTDNMLHWIADLKNLLFPATCHVCGDKLAPGEKFVCSHCLNSLPRTGFHRREMNPMEERLAGHFPFRRATGHFFYSRESALSTLIQDMKYRHFPAIGELLGETAGRELYTTGFFDGIDVIVPVPMHRVKQAIRGYNQTHHIALGISRATGLSVSHALKAQKSHRTQTSLTRDERLANTEGIFQVTDPKELEGKGVLIVDDVCTTGATMSSAASTISSQVPGVTLTVFTLGVTF